VGAPDVTVSGVAPLDRAGPDDLSFLAAKRYLQYFQQSSAAIVLCKPGLVPDDAGAGPACRVVVSDPHVALLSVIPVLYPEPNWQPGIHRTAVIGEGVAWQEPVAIGPYAVLGRGVRLGKNVRIGARCLIAGQAGIAGSTHVEDDVFLAGQAGLADHVTIGRGARVTVQGGVIGDIEPGATVSGYPARTHREFLRAQGALYRLAH